ncbi:MAG TPA: hypothetical protein VK797_01660 [Tepidisphaeraceae bacterium]|nr:hypothetical protein [Tepidisphaeraceae bacterium]
MITALLPEVRPQILLIESEIEASVLPSGLKAMELISLSRPWSVSRNRG